MKDKKREIIYYTKGVKSLEMWLLTYKCTYCGHVWVMTSPFVLEDIDCMMGCSKQPALLEMIFTRRMGTGSGRLIQKNKLVAECAQKDNFKTLRRNALV